MKQTLYSLHRSKANNKLLSHITSKIIYPFCDPPKNVFNTKQHKLFKHVLDQLPLIMQDRGRYMKISLLYKNRITKRYSCWSL